MKSSINNKDSVEYLLQLRKELVNTLISERSKERHRLRHVYRSRGVRVVGIASTVAVTATLFVLFGSDINIPTNDRHSSLYSSVLANAKAALQPKKDRILYKVMVEEDYHPSQIGTNTRKIEGITKSWTLESDDYSHHNIKRDSKGRITFEQVETNQKRIYFSIKGNIISELIYTSDLQDVEPSNPVDEYEYMINDRSFRSISKVSLDGKSAYKIVAEQFGLRVTSYIDRTTYYPIMDVLQECKGYKDEPIESSDGDDSDQKCNIDYDKGKTINRYKFEYLPLTKKNRQLLKMLPHPNAKVLDPEEEDSYVR